MNEFELLKRRESDAEKAEKRAKLERARAEAQKRLQTKKPWDDPEDRKEWLKQEYAQKRYEDIRKLCTQYPECPTCGRRQLNLRSWVISPDKSAVMCRRCYFRMTKKREIPEHVTYNVSLFSKPVPRWKLDSNLLTVMRQKLNISQYEFAERAGWSQSYQRDLEAGRQDTVGEEVARTILMVFQDYDVETADTIPPEG